MCNIRTRDKLKLARYSLGQTYGGHRVYVAGSEREGKLFHDSPCENK